VRPVDHARSVAVPSPLIRKFEQLGRLSDEEKRMLEGAVGRIREFGRDEDIVHEGDSPSETCLLLEGFAGRYRVLQSGKRQITALHIVGDFVDLHGFLLARMDHAVSALTPCKVAVVPHERLREITESCPRLARMLWLDTLVDGAIHREWLVAMGRLSALGHVSHLLCELFLRLQAAGQTDGCSFRLPLTQTDLGDALGLSTVHVNRVLQELRAEGLIASRGTILTIEDWERLKQLGEFSPTYLNLEEETR
jgi:CRP-like cAMP-binding protein